VIESSVKIELQIAKDLERHLHEDLPSLEQFQQWLNIGFAQLEKLMTENNTRQPTILKKNTKPEVHIRIVSAKESQSLNAEYRHKDKPTNVLSFESDLPDFVPSGFLGDLVICAELVKSEAEQQKKLTINHWAHLCVHGTLHLLGYDHVSAGDAEQMESIEVEILSELSIDDPYQLS
jgi:probable rRNA maturation factor